MDALERHEKAVLYFSGGKDSLACLELARPWLEKLTVLWVDTGAAFEETRLLMDRVASSVPHFVHVKTDAAEQIARQGWPVDVLPVENHWQYAQRVPRMQAYIECCSANLMNPALAAAKSLGATLIVRGQKASDAHKSALRSGEWTDGFEFLFPLEGWSDAEVFAYLRERRVEVPEHYGYVNSSLDCWFCTAYLAENAGKMRYMRERHPERHGEVKRRLSLIGAALREQDALAAALEA